MRAACVAAALAIMAAAAAAVSAAAPVSGMQYHVVTVPLPGKVPAGANPFAVALTATVTPPPASRLAPALRITAYYNGTDTWALRFTPDVPGPWAWRAADGAQGVVDVVPNTDPAAHGGLHIDPLVGVTGRARRKRKKDRKK